MAVPVAITRWFASQYPNTELNADWLEECYAFLAARNPGTNAPGLIKPIEQQLLLSDLADSTVHHAGLLPEHDGESHVLFQTGRVGVLVQVTEVLEIGRPALELLDIHKNRIEDKKVFKEQGVQVRRAIAHVEDPTQNGVGDFTQAQQEEEAKPSTFKGFPRSMLRLKVSDGFTEYAAIECERVADLSLDDTSLGCKLFLKNVRSLRGILMLDEQSCSVKGGRIADLDDTRDESLKSLLERRIRGEDDGDAVQRDQPQHRAQAQRPQGAPVRAPVVKSEKRAPPLRAPQPKSPHKRPAAKAAKKEEPVDDFDALLDDDPFDGDESADVKRPVAAVRGQAAGSSSGKADKGKGRVVKDESFQYDDDEELWASAEVAASAPQRTVKEETKPGLVPRKAPIPADAVVTVLDGSSSDAEVEAQILPPKRKRSNIKTEPIEID